ncbi:MAG: VCBS repeat-containing protein, partial [Nanoarchaeota archaeon]|nr:VCBS repeat-containing protein [Nanoarchaeota archaeon]MBU2442086.1 VCBS repeat-containing protein [Nanoarchaeota archaeon]
MKNSNVRNVKSKVILLIIVLILILILIENLAFTQAESQQLLLLSVEKPYYEVGEKVTLIITADPLSDYELNINSESRNYKFSGELSSSIDFVPNEQGMHTAELSEKKTQSLADSLEFFVGAPQETPETTPSETPSTGLISTDKKNYSVGESVQVQVSVSDTKAYKFYYEYQGMEQRYMGDYSSFSFIPVGIGTHYLVLKGKSNNEIERYSFEIVAAEEQAQQPIIFPEEPVPEQPLSEIPSPPSPPGKKGSENYFAQEENPEFEFAFGNKEKLKSLKKTETKGLLKSQDSELRISLLDSEGQDTNITVDVEQSADETIIAKPISPEDFTPDDYILRAEFIADGNINLEDKVFRWGLTDDAANNKRGVDWEEACDEVNCQASHFIGRRYYQKGKYWHDINTSFQQTTGDYDWKADKNSFRVYVKDNAIRLAGEENSEVQFQVSAETPPTINNNVITYDLSKTLIQNDEAYSLNATMSLTLLSDRMEKLIVLNDFNWPSDFEYNETLSQELANGKFIIGELSIWDSNGSVYPTSWIHEGDTIKLSINKSWLDNAVYPIFIDPTVYYNFSDLSKVTAYGDSNDAGTVSTADGAGDFASMPPTFAQLSARAQRYDFTSGGYTALAASDDSRANLTSPGANNEPYGEFNFSIDQEDTSLINWVYVTMEQNEVGTTDSDCYFLIANFTSSAFVAFGAVMSGTTDVTRTANYTGTNIDQVVNPSGIVSLMSTVTSDASEGCAVDFVSVTVSYNVSLPTFSNNATNDSSIYPRDSVEHTITIAATNENVSGYIFSWNASGGSCGTWVNSSYTSTTGRSVDASNVSVIPSACEGKTIGWKFYANTSAGWNWSDTYSYTVLNAPPIVNLANATPQFVMNGTAVNISANVTKGGSLNVDKVIARIYYPNGTSAVNYTMTNTSGSIYWNASYTVDFGIPGLYNVTIFANDTSGGSTTALTNFTPILNLSKTTDIDIDGDLSEWGTASVPVITDAFGDAGGGGVTIIDNELLIDNLNNDPGNMTIFAFNVSGTGQYESVWSIDSTNIVDSTNSIYGGGRIGDLNNDSINDFAITRYNDAAAYTLEVWTYNTSNKEWYLLWNTTATGSFRMGDIDDFDNDSINELMVLNTGTDVLEIWGNDTVNATSFSLQGSVPVTTGTQWMKSGGDLNNNTIPEILSQPGAAQPLQIFEWNGSDYEFQQNVTQAASMFVDDIDCGGDLNGDGATDCVFCGNSEKSHVLIYNFTSLKYVVAYNTSVTPSASSYTQSCFIADFNGDGQNDWVDASKDVRVFSYNKSSGQYYSVWNVTRSPAELAAIGAGYGGDSDNDGIDEIWVAGGPTGLHVFLYENDTINATTFYNSFNFTNLFADDINVIVGDFDSDGSTGGGGGGDNFDIINYSLANNNTYLFARIAVNGSVDYSDGTKFYAIYISTDSSTGNRTSLAGATLPFKYDYRLQVNGSSYCGIWNSTNQYVAACTSNNNTNTLELRATLSTINMTNETIVNITFETGTAGTVYDVAPDYNSFITYGSAGGGEPGGNNPPTLDAYDTNPDTAYTTTDLLFNITCSDVDGADTITGYVEIFNGTKSFKNASSVVTSGTEATLWTVGSGNTSKDDNWNATYWCGDATVNTSKSYDNVTILNTVPTNPSSLNINNVNVSDTLTGDCGGGSDADNDAITYHYYFYNVNDTVERQNWGSDIDYVIALGDAHDQINVT